VVDGVVVVVLVLSVVGMLVILSVVVVVVLMVDGVNVVRRVDKVVAVLDVRLGSTEVVVDGVVVDGVVQVVVDVDVGVEVITSAIDRAVVLITRPRAVTAVLVVVATVVDLEEAVRGASRNCAMSRGSVPNMAPAFRIECCLMLSANRGGILESVNASWRRRQNAWAARMVARAIWRCDAIGSVNRSLTKNPGLNLA